MNSEIRPICNLDFKLRLDLTEAEARFLDALVGYGSKSLLDVFHKLCGEHYSEPYEKVAPLFCDSVKKQLSVCFDRMKQTREVFNGEKVAIYPPSEK